MTLENMLNEAGALLGTCPIQAEQKRNKKKVTKYEPKSDFGIWLKDLVERTVEQTKKEYDIDS